jgi:hypothetical protein
MKNITILDIIKEVKWIDVRRAIKYFYPFDKNNYEKLFYDLQKYKKQAPKRNNEVITIHCNKINEYSLKQKEPIKYMLENEDFYSIQTNIYSMSFRSWKELINLPVAEETLNHYRFADIVGMFVWEITYYGNEKEMKKTGKEILGATKKIIKKIK